MIYLVSAVSNLNEIPSGLLFEFEHWSRVEAVICSLQLSRRKFALSDRVKGGIIGRGIERAHYYCLVKLKYCKIMLNEYVIILVIPFSFGIERKSLLYL